MSMALRRPHGGCWQGNCWLSQKRPYAPSAPPRTQGTALPAGAGTICAIAPTSLVLTIRYCVAGSTAPPDHVAPPIVPGHNSVGVSPGGV